MERVFDQNQIMSENHKRLTFAWVNLHAQRSGISTHGSTSGPAPSKRHQWSVHTLPRCASIARADAILGNKYLRAEDYPTSLSVAAHLARKFGAAFGDDDDDYFFRGPSCQTPSYLLRAHQVLTRMHGFWRGVHLSSWDYYTCLIFARLFQGWALNGVGLLGLAAVIVSKICKNTTVAVPKLYVKTVVLKIGKHWCVQHVHILQL